RLLEEIAKDEAGHFLRNAYRTYQGLSPDQLIDRLLGRRAASPRRLAMLFFAWHPGADEDALAHWLQVRVPQVSAQEVHRLMRAYGDRGLNLSDYAYLLSRHPL